MSTFSNSNDVADALARKQTRLAELQAETDDARWMASQSERNALELELRELAQLRTRMLEREKKARDERNQAAYEAALTAFHAPDPGEAAFIESVVMVARTVRAGLRERHAHVTRRFSSRAELVAAAKRVGEEPPEPVPNGPWRVVREIQTRIGEDMSGEGVRNDGLLLDLFHEIFDPIPPGTAAHARWLMGLDAPSPPDLEGRGGMLNERNELVANERPEQAAPAWRPPAGESVGLLPDNPMHSRISGKPLIEFNSNEERG